MQIEQEVNGDAVGQVAQAVLVIYHPHFVMGRTGHVYAVRGDVNVEYFYEDDPETKTVTDPWGPSGAWLLFAPLTD